MDKKTFVIFIVAIFFTGACGSTPSTSARQSTLQPTVTPYIPTLPPTLTATVTAQPSTWIALEEPHTATPVPPIILPDSEIPVFPGVQKVLHNLPLVLTDQRKTTLYYEVSADISEMEMFYMAELARHGWKWVYTETGESLITSVPAPALMMEFKQGDQKLGVTAHGFGGELIVLAGIDISGTELISNFIGGISGGFDLIGAPETAIKPDALHFSSTLLEFSHPSDWLATDQLMHIFESDATVSYYRNREYCSVHMEPCFITFQVSKGFHFDHPVSIRVYPGLTDMTLEEASTWRWKELIRTAEIPEERYNFPEDLTQPGTLESIEVRTLTLSDGTSAVQRVYRWKQKDVEQFIIGTYTLFRSGDLLLEFHTDFTSKGWNEVSNTVQHVITSIKLAP